jgi:hypothetical protein
MHELSSTGINCPAKWPSTQAPDSLTETLDDFRDCASSDTATVQRVPQHWTSYGGNADKPSDGWARGSIGRGHRR